LHQYALFILARVALTETPAARTWPKVRTLFSGVDKMMKLNRRRLLKGAAAGGLAMATRPFGLSAPAYAKSLKGSGTVVVYDGGGAWGDALRKAYFEPFEKETGIQVVPQPRSAAGVMRAGILAGAPKYDVMSMTGGTYYSFVKEGLLLPIDYGWWDPGQKDDIQPVAPLPAGVPNSFYALIKGFNTSVGAISLGGWADFWDAAKMPGMRALAPGSTGSQGATFEAALLAAGVPPEKLYPLDWDQAFKSLDRIKPSILKWWASGAEPVQLLLDKEVVFASAWNGRIASTREQGGTLEASWDQGILQWDCWAVPKGAANVENAMKFIAFTSQPHQQAKLSEFFLNGPSNVKAFDFLAADRASLLPTSPARRNHLIVQNYEWWGDEVGGSTNEQRSIVEWEKWVTGAR
jgi:putative spermidine/putrescine transport system substrate-binding protein